MLSTGIVAVLTAAAPIALAQDSLSWWCGKSFNQAKADCGSACPSGKGCPAGEACWQVGDVCSGKSSGGLTLDFGSGGSSVSAGSFNLDLGKPSSSWSSSSSSSSSSSATSSKGGAFDNVGSISAGSSTISSVGVQAVEETFRAMKEKFDDELFLYETPLMEWVPSSVYRFDDFMDGLNVMHTQGIAGKKVRRDGLMGDESSMLLCF